MRRTYRHLKLFFVLLCLFATSGLHAASLWQSETLADGNLYSDQVARKKGDLITITVSETTSVTLSNQTETERQNTILEQVNMLPNAKQVQAQVGASTVQTLPAISANSDKHFQGKGNYTGQDQALAAITARVMDVLDNGNLLIEGRRSVKVNKDTKTILITGIVRTADIHSDNTVLSEKLHDFQVSIVGDGPLTRAQDQGWLSNFIDVIWPF